MLDIEFISEADVPRPKRHRPGARAVRNAEYDDYLAKIAESGAARIALGNGVVATTIRDRFRKAARRAGTAITFKKKGDLLYIELAK